MVRFELFFKSNKILRERLEFYAANGLCRVNIPNKSTIRKSHLREAIEVVLERSTEIDVVPHYSIQYEFHRNRERSIEKMKEFVLFANSKGIQEILLVSGGQKRKSLDSLSALETMARWQQRPKRIRFGVAFNPYLLDSDEMKRERRRLKEKVSTGLVRSVYLQFGTDRDRLKNEMTRAKNVMRGLKIHGSVFVPSKLFLARFKFRPWRGVLCSDEYLNSVERAMAITRELLDVYETFGVEPLVETSVHTCAELERCRALLGMRSYKCVDEIDEKQAADFKCTPESTGETSVRIEDDAARKRKRV